MKTKNININFSWTEVFPNRFSKKEISTLMLNSQIWKETKLETVKFLFIQPTLSIFVWESVMWMENGSLKPNRNKPWSREKLNRNFIMVKLHTQRSFPETSAGFTLKENLTSSCTQNSPLWSIAKDQTPLRKAWTSKRLSQWLSRTWPLRPRRNNENSEEFKITLMIFFSTMFIYTIFLLMPREMLTISKKEYRRSIWNV